MDAIGPKPELQFIEAASPKRPFEISSLEGKTFVLTQEETRGIRLLG
jgi:hypothetical protein